MLALYVVKFALQQLYFLTDISTDFTVSGSEFALDVEDYLVGECCKILNTKLHIRVIVSVKQVNQLILYNKCCFMIDCKAQYFSWFPYIL